MSLEGAACRGQSALFDSTSVADHRLAREICASCPVLRDCAILLRKVQEETAGTKHAGGGPIGTWAGKLVGKHGNRDRCNPREHGTDRGYHQHRQAREPSCDDCRAAHAAAWRERKTGAA